MVENKKRQQKTFNYESDLETVFNKTAKELGMTKQFRNRGFLKDYALAVERFMSNTNQKGPSISEIENLVAVQVNAKLRELETTVKPYPVTETKVEPNISNEESNQTAEEIEDPYGFNKQMQPTEPQTPKTAKKWSQEKGWHTPETPIHEEPDSVGLEQPHKKKSEENADWVVCPTQDDWVDRNSECELCKTEHYEVYKECFRKRVADPFGPLFTIETPKPS